MSKDLYFIPIIAQALEAPNVEAALHEAFEQIQAMGQKAEYEQGRLQFEAFLELVNQYREHERQAVLDVISSDRRWKDEYDQFISDIERQHSASTTTRITLLRAGAPLGSVEVTDNLGRGRIDHVAPGAYSLQLDTGRVVWEGTLTEEDLFWTRAFPGQPLPLAADMGERRAEVTRRFSIFDGEIVLAVCAGPESGSIEIIVGPSKTAR